MNTQEIQVLKKAVAAGPVIAYPDSSPARVAGFCMDGTEEQVCLAGGGMELLSEMPLSEFYILTPIR